MKNLITPLVLSAVLFTCFSVQAATLPGAAKLVPPSTILLVETDNFSRLQQQFEKTPFYKLYKDSAMVSFFDNARQGISKKVAALDDNNLYKVFYNAGLWPQGRVAVAVILDDKNKDANQSPVLIITQWADQIDKIKDVVKNLVKKNIDMGGRQKPAEDYHGENIETLVDEEKAEMSYCFVADTLLASPDPEILKFAIARLKGSSAPALADDADYTSGLAAAGPYHDVDFFVNIKQFIKLAVADDASGETKKYIGLLGVDNVKSLAGSLGFARLPNSSILVKALLKIDGDKKGICKMLDLRSASVQPPAFIPSSAYAVGVFNLDIKAAFDELAKIVNSVSPAYASVLYTPLISASAEGGSSIELKKDIIDYLGSQIVYTEWPLKSPSEKIADSEGILAIAVSNRPALEKNLALLHSKFITPNRPDAKRELLGYTIYSIGPSALMPGLPFSYHAPLIDDTAVSDNRESSKIAFTITDTHLIFGSEQAVEKVIRLIGGPAGSSLSSEQWFSAAKSAIPSSVGLADFTNTPAVWEKMWDVFKQGTAEQKDEALSGTLAAQRILPSASETPFDFKLLPPFQAVRKYFAPTTFYGISRPDGFYFELQYINQTP